MIKVMSVDGNQARFRARFRPSFLEKTDGMFIFTHKLTFQMENYGQLTAIYLLVYNEFSMTYLIISLS